MLAASTCAVRSAAGNTTAANNRTVVVKRSINPKKARRERENSTNGGACRAYPTKAQQFSMRTLIPGTK